MGAENRILKHPQEIRLNASLGLMKRQMTGQFWNLMLMIYGEYYYKDARNWVGKGAKVDDGRLS